MYQRGKGWESNKSELLSMPQGWVPYGGKVVGEIDIDGKELGAFGRADQVFLEGVAQLLAPPHPTALKTTAPPPASWDQSSVAEL